MHNSALHVDLSQVNGSAFLRVEGDIDAYSVVTLRSVLDGVHLEKHVVVDMAGVGFMDSSGINALVDRTMRIAETGGSLRVNNPSRSVQRVIELAGVAHLFFEAQA